MSVQLLRPHLRSERLEAGERLPECWSQLPRLQIRISRRYNGRSARMAGIEPATNCLEGRQNDASGLARRRSEASHHARERP